MSPEELRAFRENIGLSRREFAPKLFISEPTLERWERGQGDIGKVQLRILRKMREHLGAGHALSYFEYDADAELPDEALHDERQAIIDILKSQMIVLLKAQESVTGHFKPSHSGSNQNQPHDLGRLYLPAFSLQA